MRLITKALLFALFGFGCIAPVQAAPPRPKLVVAISVDQFSADLFAEYRASFTGGLKRLQQGVVFPSGYQSHAATETCPGHATILTGDRPARTGIIANRWFDFAAPRDDKRVYCAEDETAAGSSSDAYTASFTHLKVPTLGDRMKRQKGWSSRVISISGKDRAAIMMGGKDANQVWWWNDKTNGFASFAGRAQPPAVAKVQAEVTAWLATTAPAPMPSRRCAKRIDPITFAADTPKTIAQMPPLFGGSRPFTQRPELDDAVLRIAAGLIEDEKLGQGTAPDLVAISLSVTDYVGHAFGTEGPEMCAQIEALDAALDRFFARLDASSLPYLVVLTADHGGHDLPERNLRHGIADARRIDKDFSIAALNNALGLKAPAIWYGEGLAGDLYLWPGFTGKAREDILTRATAWLEKTSYVDKSFRKAELTNLPKPQGPPSTWSLAERAAASFDPKRSGDLVVLLKPRVMPIADPAKGAVATHGSAWDYDRRVPILFWWPGIEGYEQPNEIETVDIMPTLAALIGLPVAATEIDGRCRDLDPTARRCP